MSDLASTEKKRRFILFSLLAVVMAAGIVVACFLLFTPKKPASTSVVAGARQEAVKGQAGGEGSEEYNRKLEKHDEKKANAALTAGESFIPTPVGNRSPLVAPKPATPPPPPAVAQPRVAPVQPPRNDNLLKRMMEDLAALDSKLNAVSAGTGNVFYQYDFSKDAKAIPVEKPIAQGTAAAADSGVAVKPGDVLYAVVETGVNSDVPSAVMATVVVGPYKNARLLGKFQRFEERLVLAFTRVILPGGEDLQLEAYAVDPSTSEASVATSVDTHFFSRWGGLVAAAFLEGLGTAKKFSGAQSTLYGNAAGVTDQMVWNTFSPADQAWIAAGKVGEKASRIFERNFDRPPTVYLEQGTPVGVLILSVKAR
jgi:type IV secretory pathway VirB10-like protein